jgi:hypothetical protein
MMFFDEVSKLGMHFCKERVCPNIGVGKVLDQFGKEELGLAIGELVRY